MNPPLETEHQLSRAQRFAELDASIRQNIAEMKRAFSNISKRDLPDYFITKGGFEQFIKSSGITLTEDDEIGLLFIGIAFDAGAALPPEMILEFLGRSSPARGQQAREGL